MDYLMWRSDPDEGHCIIKDPPVEKIWQLDEGVSRAANFPDDMSCEMDPRYPKNIQLSDNLAGSVLTVISGKVKAILEKEAAANRVEYLPVQIINHKKRLASKDYFILHPLDVCDCIDLDKSGVEWNRITANLICACKGLVLKEDAIPPDYKLFRLKYWGYIILARSDLVDKLKGAGLTGLVFREAKGYTGIG
jgi:hypothetical protein